MFSACVKKTLMTRLFNTPIVGTDSLIIAREYFKRLLWPHRNRIEKCKVNDFLAVINNKKWPF